MRAEWKSRTLSEHFEPYYLRKKNNYWVRLAYYGTVRRSRFQFLCCHITYLAWLSVIKDVWVTHLFCCHTDTVLDKKKNKRTNKRKESETFSMRNDQHWQKDLSRLIDVWKIYTERLTETVCCFLFLDGNSKRFCWHHIY